jgi:hypothetical protein
LDIDPIESLEDPTICKTLGDLHFSHALYEAAIGYYAQAIEFNPCDIDAWNKVHSALLHLGRTEDAASIQLKIDELKKKTQPISPEKMPKETIPFVIPPGTMKTRGHSLFERSPEKIKLFITLSVLGVSVIVLTVVILLLSMGGQQSPAQQGEIALDTTLIMSGGWSHDIIGGYTYEVQVTSDKPVTMFICESIDPQQNGYAACRGNKSPIIFWSLTSFNTVVDFPPEIRYLFLMASGNDTTLHLKITRLS